MKQGTVVSFNDHRGSGYLRCDETGEQVYVHWSAIRTNGPYGLKTLTEGQEVKFREFGVSAQATRQAFEVWVVA